MELRPQDELPHIPDGVDDAPWKDTWWFVARDPDTDVTVHTHFTLSANREPPARATVLVKHGAREALGLLRTDATHTKDNLVGNDLWQLEVIDPEWDDRKRLKLTARLDEVSVDLELSGRFAAVDVNAVFPGVLPDRSGGPTGPSAGGVLRHLEAAMTFTGTVRWHDGPETVASGFAIRDRSWGWRKTQEMFRYGWEGFFGHGPDYSLGLGCFRVTDEPGGQGSRSSTWIADADGVHPCDAAEIRLDGTGRPVSLSFTTTSGRTITATTEVQELAAHLPFHDPDATGNSLMIVQTEHHLRMRDQDGAAFQGMYTTARPMRASILEGTTFHTPDGPG